MNWLDVLVTQPRLSRPARAAIMIGALVLVVGIAAIDSRSDARLSFSIFYLIPIAVVAVLLGTTSGIVVAFVCALVGALGDIHSSDYSADAMTAWNAFFRLLTLSIVVLLIDALRRSLLRAQDSERRSREFLAYAAHQLRTPVAAVQASAETLMLTHDVEGQEQLLSNIAAESSRIGRLVRSLLRVARLDQGEAVERHPTDLVRICEQEIERFRHLSTSEIDLYVEPGVPSSLLLDESDVSEIIGNLLDNARRHAVARVDVSIRRRANDIDVTVRDDGPGLPTGTEDRAFERFVTLDGHGGSGLGLAIARSIAAKQGGTLTYANRAFTLCLPQ
jgi:signal transduction histidine kinase